jgi:hypothetical protein
VQPFHPPGGGRGSQNRCAPGGTPTMHSLLASDACTFLHVGVGQIPRLRLHHLLVVIQPCIPPPQHRRREWQHGRRVANPVPARASTLVQQRPERWDRKRREMRGPKQMERPVVATPPLPPCSGRGFDRCRGHHTRRRQGTGGVRVHRATSTSLPPSLLPRPTRTAPPPPPLPPSPSQAEPEPRTGPGRSGLWPEPPRLFLLSPQ